MKKAILVDLQEERIRTLRSGQLDFPAGRCARIIRFKMSASQSDSSSSRRESFHAEARVAMKRKSSGLSLRIGESLNASSTAPSFISKVMNCHSTFSREK